MQSALRPYVTAGVALVGASAIAVSPVTVPPSAVEKVQDAAVELSALNNPIDTLRPIFEQALREAREVGATIATIRRRSWSSCSRTRSETSSASRRRSGPSSACLFSFRRFSAMSAKTSSPTSATSRC